ncbi:MAG: FecR domain-containing protein [Myxococcales bacterium]|nr:FecR domain-containing protein [Myxococcales bacterium]
MSARQTGFLLCFWFVLLCVAKTSIAETSPHQAATYDYITRAGDSCIKIATEQFGDNGRYHLIHQHNSWLKKMPLPHRFEPGTILKLPLSFGSTPGPDAEVTAMQRRVEARSPADELWKLAKLGLELFRGWQISTWEKAAAEITFRDESTLNIRENTLVILFGPQKNTATTQRFNARLEKGALRSRLDALSGRPSVTVTTPSATATLREGEALVSVAEDNMCRVSNFEGKPITLTSASQPKTVSVVSGYGSRVSNGHKPEKPRLLPPSPIWTNEHTGLVVGLEGIGASIYGQWSKVNQAIGYRVELARRSDGGDVIVAALVPGDTDRFEAHGLPSGWYFVAVSAIDAAGLESRPSLRRATLVRLATSHPQDALRDHWPHDTPPDTTTVLPKAPRVLIGAMLQFHDEILCDMGDNKWSSTIGLYQGGAVQLHCRDLEQQRALPLQLDIIQPTVSALPTAGEESLVVTRGVRHPIPLRFDAPVALPSSIQIIGPPGVDVEIDRSDSGLPKIAWVTANNHVAPTFSLEVVVQNDAYVASLATLQVTIRPSETISSQTTVLSDPIQKPTRVSRLMDQTLSSSVMGVRDLESLENTVSLGIGVISRGPKTVNEVVHFSAAADMTFLDNALRLGLGHSFHFADGLQTHTASRQASRLRTDIVGIFSLQENLWISAGLTGWIPTFADDQGNRTASLVPSTDVHFRFAERFVVRTRQGVLLDLAANGSHLWASAYALDLWLWGPLALSTEFNLNIGSINRSFGWLGTITPLLHVDTGFIVASIGPTIPLNEEAQLRFGNVSLFLTGSIHF